MSRYAVQTVGEDERGAKGNDGKGCEKAKI